jgi:hypothetical protein
LGFTEQQAENALKRTKLETKKFFFLKNSNFSLLRYDLHAAMELLLTQPDIEHNENETTPFYSHNGSFIPFRQFRQQYFRANPTVRKF